MKNIISKLVFVSLLMVVITGFNVAQGQSMTLLITDNTGGAATDYYVVTWTVYSLSPYTTYPCSYNSKTYNPVGTYNPAIPIDFFANVNDVKDPTFYVYVRVVRYNKLGGYVGSGDNYAGPMTTTQLQGSWSIPVTVNL